MKYAITLGIILIFFPTLCLADLGIYPTRYSIYWIISDIYEMPASQVDKSFIPIMLLGILAFLFIISLLEAYFLKILLFKSFRKALKLSLIVNLITTLLGVFIPIFGYDDSISFLLLFTGLFLGSFLIESLFLKLLARNYSFKKIIIASFFANLASYALIFSLLLFSTTPRPPQPWF